MLERSCGDMGGCLAKVQWSRLGVVLVCEYKRQRVGCWKLDWDMPAWPGVDSVLCLARLPHPSSLDFKEKFIKDKKKKYLCLILSYNIQ